MSYLCLARRIYASNESLYVLVLDVSRRLLDWPLLSVHNVGTETRIRESI